MVSKPYQFTPVKRSGRRNAFGEDDVVGILDMPDNLAAAAISIAFSAGGACKNVKTTPLMSVQDGIEAMKKAAQCGYKPVHKAASA